MILNGDIYIALIEYLINSICFFGVSIMDRDKDKSDYEKEINLENVSQEYLISYLSDIYNRCLLDLEKLEQDIQYDSEELNNIKLLEEKNKKKYDTISSNRKKLLRRIEESKKKLDKVYNMINKV